MFRGLRRYLKRGASWLVFWLMATLFFYLRNTIYLVENTAPQKTQFPSIPEKSAAIEQFPTLGAIIQRVQRAKESGEQSDVLDNVRDRGLIADVIGVEDTRIDTVIDKPMNSEYDKYMFRDLKRRPIVTKGGQEKNKRNLTTATKTSTTKDTTHRLNTDATHKLTTREYTETKKDSDNAPGQQKLILFYNPCNFQIVRNLTNISYTFENCRFKNCKMSFNENDANKSDAVIFHWFKQLKHYPNFTRPPKQVWLSIQHEPTRQYARNSTVWPFWAPGLRENFNWTMSYSRFSDIHLPYGEMKLKPTSGITRDYLAIAKSKTKDAIWVVSKCPTSGRREEYVDILRKYIDVEILGACGRNWSCGVRSNHPLDNCFDILNKTYRYYLAFENDLCDDYVTEKFYENYEYDLLMVSRAGHPRKRSVENINKSAYIDTNDFKNPHELGIFLQNLSKNASLYAEMLAVKDKYEVISYQELFVQSMCTLCERLNNLEKYKNIYKDVSQWMRQKEPCYGVTDLDQS